MAVTPLATSDDVAELLGRDLTSSEVTQVDAILVKASELFRREARQLFTPGESATRLKATGGEVHLPQSPVISVSSVVHYRTARPVPYTRWQQVLQVPTLTNSDFVVVTYAHGSQTVPDLVRETVADVARKVFEIDPRARAGVVQTAEGTGPFTGSESYAAWATGGQTMLSPDDKATARSFRIKAPRSWVMSS